MWPCLFCIRRHNSITAGYQVKKVNFFTCQVNFFIQTQMLLLLELLLELLLLLLLYVFHYVHIGGREAPPL